MEEEQNNRLVDFCHENLGTEVAADTSFNDDYPPTNLISDNLFNRSQGFLADYFIKPPVGIRFTFRHPIHLCKLIFQPQVGQQSCQTFEIWASQDHQNERAVTKIGRSSGDHPSGLCIFQNFFFPGNRFNPDRDSTKFRLSPNHILRNITCLEIKILKTNQSGIPCLKNVRILGVPAECATKDDVKQTLSLWSKISSRKESIANQDKNQPMQVEEVVQPDPEVEIPSDFLDALTHIRMDVPMVLPCGQVIDRKTLDHYTQEEATWGRSPNDPFTGKLFTSSSRPMFDAILKARIDAFVLGRHGLMVSGLRKRRHDLLSVTSALDTSMTPRASSSSTLNVDRSTSNDNSDVTIKRSLDDIVSEALSGRKTIILGSGSRPASIACIMCKTKDNLYEVPCRHLICRQCLEIECKKSNQHLCFVCKKEWAKKDVIKFHSVVQY